MKTIIEKTKAAGVRPYTGALLVLMLALLCGCVRDFYTSPPDQSGTAKRLDARITVSTPVKFGSASPGAAPAADAEVKHVYALLMNDGNVYAVAEGRNIAPVAQSNKVTFDVSFVIEAQHSSRNFKILLLANLPKDRFSLAEMKGWINRPRSYVEEHAIVERTNPETDDVKTPLVMYGETAGTVTPGSKADVDIQLLRSVAKVEVSLGDEVKPEVFTLEELYIYKASSKYAVIPKLDSGNPVLTIPDGQVSQTKFKADKMNQVYLPESKVVFGTADAVGDANHQNRCAIVVGGRYNGSATNSYYRIDFTARNAADQSAASVFMDVLRNHRFIVKITSVGSVGEPTPDEAYKSVKSSISAGVIDWVDENRDIVFDGESWVSIETKHVEFADGAGIQTLVLLNSNVPPSMWKMKLEGAPDDNPFVSTYFSVEKPDDKPASEVVQGGYLVIKTLKDLPEFTGTKPDPDKPGFTIPDHNSTRSTPRHDTLVITISRLEIRVKITQYPYSPNEWTDGGIFDGSFG